MNNTDKYIQESTEAIKTARQWIKDKEVELANKQEDELKQVSKKTILIDNRRQ